MRDFPIFTTEFGVSSLILREIPYKNEAYIRIRDVQPGKMEEHLAECAAFCRMAGAERIFAAGVGLDRYPIHASVLKMQGNVQKIPEKTACLFPVTEETVSKWRQIHNEAMVKVDNAGTLEKRDEGDILKSTGASFIHEDGTLLGIGWVEDDRLLAVAAVRKGAGERILYTLMSGMETETMTLEVASTNERAIRLYERLGFVTVGVVTVWHDVTMADELT